MTNWKVAPTYQNWKIEKIDESAKKIRVSETCYKCGGSGYYGHFGVCFACNGAGKHSKWVKAYTPEEYDRYIQNQERTKARKAKEKAAYQQSLIDNSEDNKKIALTKAGYDAENPLVYLVGGGNTYAIKDELKEMGCLFNRALGWHAHQLKEVPEGYEMIAIPFDSIYDWNCFTKKFNIKTDAEEVAKAAIQKTLPESHSEYIGEIKERLRDIHVKLISQREVESYYGISTLYTFSQEENVLVWFCSGRGLDDTIQVGDEILLTGTVKAHDEYNGIKQTRLNRCIAKRV